MFQITNVTWSQWTLKWHRAVGTFTARFCRSSLEWCKRFVRAISFSAMAETTIACSLTTNRAWLLAKNISSESGRDNEMNNEWCQWDEDVKVGRKCVTRLDKIRIEYKRGNFKVAPIIIKSRLAAKEWGNPTPNNGKRVRQRRKSESGRERGICLRAACLLPKECDLPP